MTKKLKVRSLLTVEEVEAALKKSNGLITPAARLLGVSYAAVHNMLQAYPELKEIRDEARATTVDLAEMVLTEQITKKNMTAVIFALKTLGKDRGYSERTELVGANGSTIMIVEEPRVNGKRKGRKPNSNKESA